MLNLNKRERFLLQILIVIIIITIVYYLIVLPLIEFAQNAEEDLKNNTDNISKIDRIYEQFRDVQEKKTRYLDQLGKKNENITSMVEQWANSTGIASNIAYTRRNQSTVQNKYIRITTNIKVEGVAIQKFLKFLYEIEHSNMLLKTSYLRIRPALKGTKTYDIDLKIDSFTSK